MAREVEVMKWDIRESVETRDPTERVLDVGVGFEALGQGV